MLSKKSVAAAFATQSLQPLSSFGAAFAGRGREQNSGLVAIFRNAPAGAEKLGETNLRAGVSLFHRHPQKLNRCRYFRRAAGSAKDLQGFQIFLLPRFAGVIGRGSLRGGFCDLSQRYERSGSVVFQLWSRCRIRCSGKVGAFCFRDFRRFLAARRRRLKTVGRGRGRSSCPVGGRNLRPGDFGAFRGIIARDLMAKPDDRSAEFAVVDIRAGEHGKEQHDADGAPQCKAIHPTWIIGIALSFK